MAVFQESGDAGANISEAAGIVSIPEFNKIEGSSPTGAGDVDIYELQLESDATVIVENDGEYGPIALLDSQGDVLSSPERSDETLSFDGEAGETFFLRLGEELGPDELTTPAFVNYEVSLSVSPDFPTVEPAFDEIVYGTNNDDTLTGESNDGYFQGLDGDDLISGGEGEDFISGDEGADSLKGNDGNDTIYGGNGNDILVGGKGTDILYDEAGNDVFYYSNINQSVPGNSRDRIGMDAGEDRIDLKQIDADLNNSGDQAFDFIGTNRFTAGSTGQVRYDPSNNLIQVEVHGDGDTIVDMEIASHKDFSSLSEDDFIL